MTAVIFPGQGSQEKGMGEELYHSYPEMRKVFELGSDVTDRKLEQLCFDTDNEILSRTENAQLAIFTVSMGIFEIIKNINFSALAGFSLGECSALCAGGVFSLEDGFRLVCERARLMQRVCDAGGGAMSAILGLEDDIIKEISSGYDAMPVNFNCPGQVVIAGTVEGVSGLERQCLHMGAKRVVRLRLSGAFHTAAMQPAAKELKRFPLKTYPITSDIYSNAAALPIPFATDIPGHLALQMTSPVLWRQSVENMIKDKGIDIFIEVGNGQSLSQFVKKTDKTVKIYQTGTLSKLTLVEKLF